VMQIHMSGGCHGSKKLFSVYVPSLEHAKFLVILSQELQFVRNSRIDDVI